MAGSRASSVIMIAITNTAEPAKAIVMPRTHEELRLARDISRILLSRDKPGTWSFIYAINPKQSDIPKDITEAGSLQFPI